MSNFLIDAIKNPLKEDVLLGLLGTFVVLHFYYGVPVEGWSRSSVGGAAILAAGVVLFTIGYWAGKTFFCFAALVSGAIALDLFQQGQAHGYATSLEFEYLSNGTAAVNFASFAFLSSWCLMQYLYGLQRR